MSSLVHYKPEVKQTLRINEEKIKAGSSLDMIADIDSLNLSPDDHGQIENITFALPYEIETKWEKGTIWECFKKTASIYPDVICMQTNEEISFTYREVLHAASCAARIFGQAGIRKGMRVAVRCESQVDFILISLGLYALGAVKIALSESIGIYEESYKLSKVHADLLIEDKVLHSTDSAFEYDGSTLVIDWSNAHARGNIERWIYDLEHSVSTIKAACSLPNDEQENELVNSLPDDICDIFFTSGSTGAPKAVGLSHDMMLRSAWANCLNRKFSMGYRLCIPLPLSHVYGYIDGFLAIIQVAGTMLLPAKKLTPGELVEFVKDSSAQDILLVPNLAIAMIEYIQDHPTLFPYLEAVYCSASSCPDWLWASIRSTFNVSRITTGYGMTEVCGASFQTLSGDSDEILINTVGRLMDGGSAGIPELEGRTIEYKTIDNETGRTLPQGETGELCCRGVSVFKGYLENDAANAKAFDSDGWFHTGDIGRIDKNGYLHLEGRTSETYKINGENVSPWFVERIVGKCPLVKRICIVGIPEARYGEVGAAFIELTIDTSSNRREVKNFCKNALARFQIPKYYFFVSADFWPTNETGKVVRPRLSNYAKRVLNDYVGEKTTSAKKKEIIQPETNDQFNSSYLPMKLSADFRV